MQMRAAEKDFEWRCCPKSTSQSGTPMNLNASDLAHLLLALSFILSAAHGVGYIFRRFGQPPVIGEILGGLLLGPTGLGFAFPGFQKWLFSSNSAALTLLGAIYQLGLLLLMFCSGTEVRSSFRQGEKKTVGLITLIGTGIPFGFGLIFLRMMDADRLMGMEQNSTALLLVSAIAIAVTSIPVISRILLDLGIIDTDFSRIVLTVAVLEDIILYVILAVALAIAGGQHNPNFGLPRFLGIQGDSHAGLAYYVVAALLFFTASLWLGPQLFRRINSLRLNLLKRGNPVAHLLVFLIAMTGAVLFLGLPPMFGAFVSGIVVGTGNKDFVSEKETIKNFSFAFFIPIYFEIVGLKLDLIRHFDPVFFLAFLAFACAVKALSVYAGAMLSGESKPGSFNLAVALNARGGPGIVLASLAYDARIINDGFYVILVMLAIITSLLAGSWLSMVVRRNWPLR
jgi:Kef-type K+ transport system membrane component KefB